MRPASPLLLLLALGLAGLLARPAAAADWTVKTASNAFGAGRQDFRYTVNPGGHVEDGVVVVNHGAAALHVALRADLKWVRLRRDDVTVPPGKSAEVPFTLALPGDAKPGDYMGAIVADRRSRIPIRLRVGGPLRPSLAVERLHVDYGSDDTTVTYTIRNTGNAILAARQSVSVSGPFGRWDARARKIADSPPLLPGDSFDVSVPVRGVTPALRLTATVTLVPLLTDAAGSTAPLTAVKASGHGWAVPWPPLAGLLALVAAGVGFRARRRATAA